MKTIYTIGHSTRSYTEFLELLQAYGIEAVADIRSFPGSRKFPQFNKEHLETQLPQDNIVYIPFKSLGGRRKPAPDSKNTAWRHQAFRGYADYMESEQFISGINELQKQAQEIIIAVMCSEAVWWRCHRSMVADYLKANLWKVIHIINKDYSSEHPYTSPAQIVEGKLTYKTSVPDQD
ncbi:MAG TPA: DUF488 domain-containing protein [Flavobacterium sp.]